MKKSLLPAIFITILCCFLLNPTTSYSQFGGFGKKLKGALESTEEKKCDASKNLEQRMKVLRENAADLDRNGPLIPSSIENAKSAIKSVKSKCPHVSTADEEKEIEDIRTKYETYVSDKDSKQKEGNFLKDVFKTFKEFQGHFSSSKGLYSDLKFAEGFNKDCKGLDYINNQKKVNDFATKYPDVKVKGNNFNFEYNFIANEFHNGFRDAIDNYFVKEIDNAIELSFASKSEGKEKMSRAKDQMESALLVSEGILTAFPDNTKVKELHGVAKESYDKMSAEFSAAVFTSPIHKENAGKIVFSNKPIIIKQENAGQFKNEFNGGDDIYAMLYFDGTILDKTRLTNTAEIFFLVDGNEKVKHKLKFSKEENLNTFFPLEIAPDPNTCKTPNGIVFTKILSEMSPRKHTIKVFCKQDDIIAEGEFMIDGSSGIEKYTKKLKDLEQWAINQVRMPEAMMNDKAIESKMKQAIKRAGWQVSVLRIVICHAEWQFEKNDLGITLNRFLRTAVAYKTKEGKCNIGWVYFYEEKVGSAWGDMKIENIDDVEINCNNVNK